VHYNIHQYGHSDKLLTYYLNAKKSYTSLTKTDLLHLVNSTLILQYYMQGYYNALIPTIQAPRLMNLQFNMKLLFYSVCLLWGQSNEIWEHTFACWWQ